MFLDCDRRKHTVGKHQIPIKKHCLTRLSICGRLSKKVFHHVKLLFTVCFIQSQSKHISLFKYYCLQLLQLFQT